MTTCPKVTFDTMVTMLAMITVVNMVIVDTMITIFSQGFYNNGNRGHYDYNSYHGLCDNLSYYGYLGQYDYSDYRSHWMVIFLVSHKSTE